MVHSVEITNFRCFQNLRLTNLKPINLIVGENASGKTALLEALFLAFGASPELVFRIRTWRGGGGVQFPPTKSSYENLWQDLFYNLDQARTIAIELQGSPEHTRSLTILYKEQDTLTLPLGGEQTDATRIVPVTFQWKTSKGEVFSVQPTIGPRGLDLGMPGQPAPATFFASQIPFDPTENATRFSELSKAGKEKEFVEVLTKEFPWVGNISIELNAGIPQLYASVHSLGKKIPLTTVSGGVNKLVSILLAISTFPGGTTLIDEIENGFYFERHLSIWSLLFRFSFEFKNQIFATTHSLECIKSLLPIIKVNEEDFCLIRVHNEDGRATVKQFAGKDVRRAIENDIEMR